MGKRRGLLRNAALLAAFSIGASADDGIWTYHQPPLALLKAKHGIELTPQWLEKLRLASVSMGDSASFVSSQGLIFTNAHVAHGCVKDLSSPTRDLLKNGFLARAHAAELKCPGVEARTLVSYADVTREVASPDIAERNRRSAAAEKQCRESTGLRCEVVTLYRGAEFWIYRYKVWSDVRLVFQPESDVAFFGQDTDNFVYPRFALDAAFLRAYEDGKPAPTPHFLAIAKQGVADGDLVFTSGNPGSTDRLLTVAELLYRRDQQYPLRLSGAEDLRDALEDFAKGSPESRRRAQAELFGLENYVKVMKGENKALNTARLLDRKRADENTMREKAREEIAAGRFQWRGGDPWERIARAVAQENARAFELQAIHYAWGSLPSWVNDVAALAYEAKRPDGERLKGYREARVVRVKRRLEGETPWHKDLEAARLAQRIQESMDLLGQSHPFVARLTGGRPPGEAAKRLIDGTRLDQAGERRTLLQGGAAAIDASRDPLLVALRDLYPTWSSTKRFHQDEVEGEKEQAYDEIARFKHHLGGATESPDATGTLRFSFGKVLGYDREGVLTPWTTTFHGLFDRHASLGSNAHFNLPPSWKRSARRLALDTPFNFVTNLDIIGGSSGSPVVNRVGELVGILFDGNLESLGNRFVYSDRIARSLAVDIRAVVEALDKVYGADGLLAELNARR